ncbi:GDSL esterase/lipase At4g18970-like [Amaranthus tricolor]|uniref:GDSL esterase/lipase At4g18970-like n=1 Tax=Amaranthus tricolor TaxID=29722 RepID=UPI0025889E14|nr:GDSL esterase/lipase At4g18970-like [Amaranthus tricolor]
MWRISALIIVIITLNINLGIHANPKPNPNPIVPCYFIFGDSLSDSGNNNGLKTKAKANYHPYGLDFPGGKPTGRFTNGRTSVDEIAQRLGHGFIPPFSTAKGQAILKGVNYASGAAGILPETGKHLGDVVTFDEQLTNHKRVISKVFKLMKNGSTQAYMQKCLYTVNIGSNDYINNYFMPLHYQSSRKYSPNKYAHRLVNKYRQNLKILYKNGARKVALFGLGMIGCSLGVVMQHHPIGFCVDEINFAVQMFNNKLQKLVGELNQEYHDAKFTCINIQAIVVGPLQGITKLRDTCCELREDYQCKESAAHCPDRNSHFFWDGFHPTEAVQKVWGARAFNRSLPVQANPLDINSLIKYKL